MLRPKVYHSHRKGRPTNLKISIKIEHVLSIAAQV